VSSIPRTGEPEAVSAAQSPWRRFQAGVRGDHGAMRSARERYPTDGTSMESHGTFGDAIHNIGFQMLVVVRVMQLFRDLGVPLMPQVCSRLIRHLYSAEIHWNAQLDPGITIVHGNGLVISHGARVATGCILFQHVTLGESIDPLSRIVGAPTLDEHVHVGPGAVLLGPIHIGGRSKIMANSVVDRSVPAGSVVRGPSSEISSRDGEKRDQ
jgi:serine acetyltransferase